MSAAVCALLVLLLAAEKPAAAQSQVEPYFHIIVDTSGSMGDCCGVVSNTCGQPSTKMNAAKCVLADLVNAFGDVIFGLTEFDMGCFVTPPPSRDVYASTCNPDQGAASISPDRARTLVPLGGNNQNQLLSYVDFSPTYSSVLAQSCPGSDEPGDIYTNNADDGQNGGWGLTPLAGSLYSVQRYYQGNDPDFGTSPIATDPFIGCRPYYVILLTDGDETCAFGTAANQQANNRQAVVDAATALRSTTVPGAGTHDIRTFVIGFGISPGDTDIEAIAQAGGTNAPGANRGFYAQNQTELALAFSQIVQSSLLQEVCDNVDNDCDCPGDTNGDGTVCGPGDDGVDEGFIKYCDLTSGITDLELCANPGDPCDGTDDNCYIGTTDEVTNACGTCGPPPMEVCNLVDDDCDNFIDEGGVCGGCNPEAEICDGKDNDCDGRFDEGITRPCGTDEGLCTAGTQDCVEQPSEMASGTWGPCSDTPPAPEMCDGFDNNCDGVVDGFSRECYTFADGCTGDPMSGYTCDGICQSGNEICTAGMWGGCQGEIGPGTEICNNVDDDCDGDVDEGDPGGGGDCSLGCGVGTLECNNGMLECVGSGTGMPEVCNGFDDDCDGSIDEAGDLGPPIGDPCDEGGTLCVPGTIECVGGVEQCVGGVPPEPEACNCEDDDCDGSTDEEDMGPLCPPGATCLAGPYCLCARPCATGEFPCPLGFECVDPAGDGNRFCVPDPCADVTCTPDNMGNPTVCVDGDCVGLCDTVSCPSPTVCRPSDGQCVEDNCNGFPELCDDDELCRDGTCEANPCFDVECPADQFCRGGDCTDSCAGVECPEGQSCDSGSCVDDPCGGIFCPDFQVCDPETSECEQDQCPGRSCPPGLACDPQTGECEDDPCFGIECPGEQICSGGNCFDEGDLQPPKPPRDNTFVAPGGGGGCAAGDSGTGVSWLVALLGMAMLFRRRERTR